MKHCKIQKGMLESAFQLIKKTLQGTIHLESTSQLYVYNIGPFTAIGQWNTANLGLGGREGGKW